MHVIGRSNDGGEGGGAGAGGKGGRARPLHVDLPSILCLFSEIFSCTFGSVPGSNSVYMYVLLAIYMY